MKNEVAQPTENTQPNMDSEGNGLLKVKLFRFDPSVDKEPRYEGYTLPYDPQETILRVLQTIREQYDPSLAFRNSCDSGCCNICSVRVNGKAVLACFTNVPAPEITIEPTHREKVIRDLVTE